MSCPTRIAIIGRMPGRRLAVALLVWSWAGLAQAQLRHCNGAAHLCQRPYDQVAYATTHNAMSNRDDGWIAPNQEHDIPTQLASGVRGLMLDVHEFLGQVYLCHANCLGGNLLLVDGLAQIGDFLDANPDEVVTIIFESYVPAELVAEAFFDSGLIDYVYTHSPDDGWPTLEEMINRGERLVVFTDRDGGAYPWYLGVWTYAWETHFSNEAPEDFSCDDNRGSPSNDLFILNHFLTLLSAETWLAEKVNYNPLFIDRARQCQEESGRLPNFVTVDFYTIGDLFEVVASLNATQTVAVRSYR